MAATFQPSNDELVHTHRIHTQDGMCLDEAHDAPRELVILAMIRWWFYVLSLIAERGHWE